MACSGRPTNPRRTLVGAMVIAVVAAALAGCSPGSPGMARLTVDGQVEISSGHGKAHPAASGNTLRAGDQVHVISGRGSLRLLQSGLLEMRAGTILTIGRPLRLTSGAVLIQPGNQPVRVSALNATLSVPFGAAQLSVGSRLQGLVAKVYQSRSTLEIPGNPAVVVAAPRQVTLTPAVKLPVQATPLLYRDGDEWDHRYLAEEVALSTQLAAAAAGFDAQLSSSQGKDAAFYQQLLPSLAGQPDFTSVPTVQREAAKPGDYLIALVIALRGTRDSFIARLNEELLFSGQGASWGFVALDQGVTDLSGVLNDVLAAIRRAQLPLSGAPSAQVGEPPPPVPPSPPTSPSPASGGFSPSPPVAAPVSPRIGRAPSQAPPTTGAGPPLIQLPPLNLPPPLGTVVNPLLDPLIALLNSILRGGRH